MENCYLGDLNMISFVYAYYNSSRMLKLQLDLWCSLSENIRKNCQFILIDDGSSDKAINYLTHHNLQLELYEIKENIPWNDVGASNLGFHVVKTEWVFRSDLDYFLSEKSFSEILKYSVKDGEYYTFKSFRKDTGETVSEHPSTILVKRDDFWKAGGYDEDFVQHYGYSDILLRENLTKILVHKVLPINIYVDTSGATVGYDRDTKKNYELLLKKRSGEIPKSNTYLRFSWEKVI